MNAGLTSDVRDRYRGAADCFWFGWFSQTIAFGVWVIFSV
jgi:hypothetical protein